MVSDADYRPGCLTAFLKLLATEWAERDADLFSGKLAGPSAALKRARVVSIAGSLMNFKKAGAVAVSEIDQNCPNLAGFHDLRR